jgi:hypothetical protein
MMTSSRAANPLCAARSIDQIGRQTSRSALGIRFQDVRSRTEPSR